MLTYMSVGRILSRGALVDFLKVLLGGPKSGEICFLPPKTKKTSFFAEIPAHPHTPMLVYRKKLVPQHLNIGVISSVLTPFQIVKFCWILYIIWNVWQIDFNCVFVFALATLNSYIYFCIGNTIGVLTENVLVATYALPCLCILVSNAVVEWVFSHVASVSKMRISCDFECV